MVGKNNNVIKKAKEAHLKKKKKEGAIRDIQGPNGWTIRVCAHEDGFEVYGIPPDNSAPRYHDSATWEDLKLTIGLLKEKMRTKKTKLQKNIAFLGDLLVVED